MKPKSLENIEKKLEEMNPESLRYHILENAKSFKTSSPLTAIVVVKPAF